MTPFPSFAPFPILIAAGAAGVGAASLLVYTGTYHAAIHTLNAVSAVLIGLGAIWWTQYLHRLSAHRRAVKHGVLQGYYAPVTRSVHPARLTAWQNLTPQQREEAAREASEQLKIKSWFDVHSAIVVTTAIDNTPI